MQIKCCLTGDMDGRNQKYKRRFQGKSASFVALVLPLIFSVVFCVVGGGRISELKKLHEEGERVTASIVGFKQEKGTPTTKKYSRKRNNTTRFAIVEFTSRQGETRRVKCNLEGYLYNPFERGDKVEVILDPYDNSNTCISGWGNWTFPALITFAGVLIFGIWCKIVISQLKRKRIQLSKTKQSEFYV